MKRRGVPMYDLVSYPAVPTFKLERVIRLHFIFISMVVGLFSASTLGAEPPQPQHHFLFVVDSSVSMSPHRASAIKLVRDVITSRFDGQIESGDSIDIWTYDTEKNLSGFPPQIWRQADSLRITELAADYLEKYPFKGKGDFSKVASDLGLLVPEAKSLLIVIVTDGETPFSGFHLDLEINGYLSKRERLGPGKGPFLISLAAIDGKIRTWTAYFGSGEFGLATLPLRGKPKISVAQTKKIEPNRPNEIAPLKAAPKLTMLATGMVPSTPESAENFTFNFPPGTKITPVTPMPARAVRPPLAANLSKSPVSSNAFVKGDALVHTVRTNAPAAVAATAPATNAAAQMTAKDVTNSAPVVSATNSSHTTVATVKTISQETQPPEGKDSSKSFDASVSLDASASSDPSKGVPASKGMGLSASRTRHGISKVEAAIGNSSTAGTESALRRGIYISVGVGISCLLAGGYLLLRRFRRPNESIISRSLLER